MLSKILALLVCLLFGVGLAAPMLGMVVSAHPDYTVEKMQKVVWWFSKAGLLCMFLSGVVLVLGWGLGVLVLSNRDGPVFEQKNYIAEWAGWG